MNYIKRYTAWDIDAVIKRILIKSENKLKELIWQNTNAKEDVWQSIKNVARRKNMGHKSLNHLGPVVVHHLLHLKVKFTIHYIAFTIFVWVSQQASIIYLDSLTYSSSRWTRATLSVGLEMYFYIKA
jgi:hypothetical protein